MNNVEWQFLYHKVIKSLEVRFFLMCLFKTQKSPQLTCSYLWLVSLRQLQHRWKRKKTVKSKNRQHLFADVSLAEETFLLFSWWVFNKTKSYYKTQKECKLCYCCCTQHTTQITKSFRKLFSFFFFKIISRNKNKANNVGQKMAVSGTCSWSSPLALSKLPV